MLMAKKYDEGNEGTINSGIPSVSANIDDHRWHSLLRILQYKSRTVKDLLDYTLNEAIGLTGSKIGYIYNYDVQRREFVLNSWSENVMKDCKIVDPQTCYELDKTGLWGEAVRQGKPIIRNDYQAPDLLKKGLPQGHINLNRFLTLPVFAEGVIVAVVGVANKETDYDQTDVLQLQLLMDAVWKVVEQKYARENERKARVELQERVKELTCISAIGEEMQKDLPVSDFCLMVISNLKNAMSCPDAAKPVIEYDGKLYTGCDDTSESNNFIEAVIVCVGKKLGILKVYNPEGTPFILPEEQKLIDTIARMAGMWFNRKESVTDLRHREEDLFITLRSIGEGVIATDTEGRIVKMNPVAELLTGWNFSEISDKYLKEFIPLVDAGTRTKIEHPVNKVLKTGQTIELANHTLLISRDGTERQISDNASPIFDDRGNLRGAVFVFSDVTGQYSIMEQLRKSEEKFRLLAEKTLTILWEYNIELDRWTYIAPQVKKILGYDPEEWTDYQFWLDRLHENDREWAHKYCSDCVQKGEDHVFEYRFLKKDGSYAWLLDEVSVGLEMGKPVKLWGSIRDITSRKIKEEVTRESEEIYRSAFRTSPDAVNINRLDGLFIDVNKGFTKLTGYTRDEVIGKLSSEINIWKIPAHREKLIEGLKNHGYVENLESVFLCKDGSSKSGIMSASIIKIKDEPHILSITRDISLRERMEKLRKVQYHIAHSVMTSVDLNDLYDTIRNELNSIFDTSNFIIAFYNKSTGMISAPFEKSEKAHPKVWPADKSLSGMVIREKRSLLLTRQEIKALAEAGKINFYGSRSEKWLGVPLHVDGSVNGAIIVQSYTDPDAYDETSVEFLEAIASQISLYIESKQNQEKALKLTRAVEQSPISIVITDIKSNIEYVNPQFLKLTGYSAGEVKGQNPRILQSGRHDKAFYKKLYDTILSGNDWQGEMLNKKKNGELFWEMGLISPVFNQKGEIINFIGIKEDISEKKKLLTELVAAKEKAEESDRLKTAFLANISHEIRTPMNSIVGFSGLLKRNKLSPGKKTRYIETINANANHLLGLIEDLLDISQIESGNLQLSEEIIDIRQLFEDLHKRFQPLKPGIDINYQIKGIESFYGDRLKLNQILSNLIGNAVKFTVSGRIEYSVKKEKDFLIFNVQDTGSGIMKKDLEKIFERFAQGTNSVWLSRSGTGLGLALAKAYVEKMGGEISVVSEWGKGSMFLFSLPFKNPENIGAGLIGSIVRPGLSVRKKKILVAEDDPSSFLLIGQIFEGTKNELVHASNGREAVDLFKNDVFDLILMDINMPVMGGLEATRVIKSINSEIPIIAISAHAFKSDKNLAFESGCDYYITKPLKVNDLMELVREVLK
jgi:PAS domain S-box-containing protein